MASFNATRVYINTRATRNGTSIYRIPVAQPNESFYFNQDDIKAIVYFYTNNNVSSKEVSVASIHLTNKRLILLAQSSSIASSSATHFDTCEFQLSDFLSLKTESKYKKCLRFDLKTIRQEKIRIDITFYSKKDAARRDSLKEYIKMATSAILSNRNSRMVIPQQQLNYIQDELPSYLEATNANGVAPPAYN